MRFNAGWPVTLATLISLVILLGLGTWQLNRLAWKEQLIAGIETALAGPAIAIDDAGLTEFTKVSLTPQAISETFARYGSGADHGVLTSRVLRAVETQSGRTWLVDFGALPIDAVPAVPALVEIVGIARPPNTGGTFTPANDLAEGQFYSHDLAALDEHFGVSFEPWVIDTVLFTKPPNIPNNHFVYALTWYGIAAGLVGVYIAFGRRQVERDA